MFSLKVDYTHKNRPLYWWNAFNEILPRYIGNPGRGERLTTCSSKREKKFAT